LSKAIAIRSPIDYHIINKVIDERIDYFIDGFIDGFIDDFIECFIDFPITQFNQLVLLPHITL